jgi:predicted dehydrogenase
MRPIIWGLIGGGKDSLIGDMHRTAASMRNNFKLVGGMFSGSLEKSRSFGRTLKLPDSRIYDGIEDLIHSEQSFSSDERIRAVSIITPNYLHYQAASKLVEAGFHVICEKPMTITFDEANELRKVVESKELIFAVTYTYSGYPMVRQMKSMIASKRIGEVQKVDVQYYQGWINPIIKDDQQRKNTWRLDPKRAGISCCMGDIGTHAFHLVEYVTDLSVEELLADLNNLREDNLLDVDGSVLLRMQNGIKGIIRTSQIATAEENNLSIVVYGSEGFLRWEQENPNYLEYGMEGKPLQVLKRGQPYNDILAQVSTKLPQGHPEGIYDAMGNIYAGVAKAINGSNYHPAEFPSIKDGLRGMDFIEKSVHSHRNNASWVRMNKL